ncbi:MAG: hypothetical protein ACREF5_00375 [Candidatus Saccharimonadales bacterium]
MKNVEFNQRAIALLGGYLLQFLAGMFLNLFVTIPSKHPGSSGDNYLGRSFHSLVWSLSGSGGWVLSFHAGLALLLVLGSLSLFVMALIAHSRLWSVSGGIAALLTLGAFFNGLSFIDFNKNISSMIMAICWVGAVSVLVLGLLKHTKSGTKTSQHVFS